MAKTKPVHIDAPRGERGDFRKVTITLPPEVYEQLVNESARRKIADEPNHLLSGVIREALLEFLSGGPGHTSKSNRG
jgi:transcriptional regulator of met regulon